VKRFWSYGSLMVGVLVAVVLLASFSLLKPTTESKAAERKPADNKPDASTEFFTRGMIPEIKITVEQAEYEKLRNDPRHYVRCELVENGTATYKSVAIKLKGAAGSFRGVDDRPALTIITDKYQDGQKFHDLKKFHLNNSVQDESYLNELICSEIALKAGIPATRVSHARVWLNGRDLGFYVLKEGFDKKFLGRHFPNNDGNFYDGGFCTDINTPLEKDSGTGPDDRSDLKALVQSCLDPDVNRRQQTLEQLIDVDAFCNFIAFELLTCHWDGYARNRNNYRVYFEPTSKKAYFLPHGMDQMFGNTGEGVFDIPGSIVCQGVLNVPDFRNRYEKKLRALIAQFSPAEPWLARIDEVQKRLQPALTAIHPDRARHQQERANDFKNRLVARASNLQEQLKNRPVPVEFDAAGALAIKDWHPEMETPDSKLSGGKSPDGRDALLIEAGASGRCVASWRAKVLLPPGRYKLVANVRTQNVQSLEDDKGKGAGVRVSGGIRTNTLQGNSDWKSLEFPLEVSGNPTEMVLVAELRSSSGQAWFETNSLRVVKVSP
jgi:spore coat protein H